MNIIQRHADTFFRTRGYEKLDRKCKDIIDDLKMTLFDYNKDSYKLEYIERLMVLYKESYDRHLLKCNAVNKSDCPTNQFHEDVLFFLQAELENIETKLDSSEFSILDKKNIDKNLEKILYEINLLKLGQELTYDDFKEEFDEMKDHLFLSKKNWTEMFIGKIAQMIASGIISETVSQEIVKFIKENYPRLLA
jgi:hypothetical protein